MTELTVQPNAQNLVFGTFEPRGVITRATEVSNQLKQIVDKSKLYNVIGKKKFVYAEGWTAMCAMIGVFPQTVYCKRLEREGEIAYEAKVALRHISGAEVGSGESICSSREKNWAGRDEYAVKSMAQTRAVGKACRLSFSWIMALAGYEAVPAEEIAFDRGPIPAPQAREVDEGEVVDTESGEIEPKMKGPSAKAIGFYHVKLKLAGLTDDHGKRYMGMKFNKKSASDLSRDEFTLLIQWLDEMIKANGTPANA